MRLSGSDRLLLAAFGALAVGSIAVKAAAGPARDGWSDQNGAAVVADLRHRLESEGFATAVIPLKIESPIVLGRHGACRLSVRDARGGKPMMATFARDTAAIGPIRYLYKGSRYDAPPGLRIRLGRLETELLSRMEGAARAHIPVALATSTGCGGGDHGLGDVSIAV